MSARFIFLLKSKSKVSSERSGSRKRACLCRRAISRSCAAEQFVGDERGDEIDGRLSFGLRLAQPRFEDVRPCRRAGACGARDRVRRDSLRVSCLLIDEVAIERELANERDRFAGA